RTVLLKRGSGVGAREKLAAHDSPLQRSSANLGERLEQMQITLRRNAGEMIRPITFPSVARLVPGLGTALGHPCGVVLFSLSLAIAAAMRFLPALAPIADRAGWVLDLGAIGYLVAVVVLLIFPGGPIFAELESVQATRDAIASLVRNLARRERGDDPSALTLALNRAVIRLAR